MARMMLWVTIMSGVSGCAFIPGYDQSQRQARWDAFVVKADALMDSIKTVDDAMQLWGRTFPPTKSPSGLDVYQWGHERFPDRYSCKVVVMGKGNVVERKSYSDCRYY